MSEYSLNLFEDRLGLRDEATWPLGEGYRIIYVVEGEVDIAGAAGHSSTHGQNSAWLGTGACVARATTDQTRLWRWDLVPGATGGQPAEDSVHPGSKASHSLTLEPPEEFLMRCDRVDFPPGGIAYTHTHAGPGTRCLQGELRVTVQKKTIVARPGDAWFESGPEPVLAVASATGPTSFVRTMILPRSFRGRSSIRYVKPEDADKPKLQEYTRFVEEDIEVDAR